MGMQFSPMYQPVSTKTIKADGDLNVSPYDIEAYDGRFDTVEADEFVGGVGNFTSLTEINTSKFMYTGQLLTSGTTQVIQSVSINTVTLPADYTTQYNIGTLYVSPYIGLIDISNSEAPNTATCTLTASSSNLNCAIYLNNTQIGNITSNTSIEVPFEYGKECVYKYRLASGQMGMNPTFKIQITTPSLYID